MTIQAMEKAIENLECKVAKLEFEVYEQRRTIGQLIMEKADRKTEPQRGCDADCYEDCTECAKEWQDWKDQMWTEAVIASKDEPQTYKPTCNGECRNCEYRAKDGNYCMKTDCAWQNDEYIPTELASTMLKSRFKEQK